MDRIGERRDVTEAKRLAQTRRFQRGRILVVAFEGWNDAGEAATNAVRMVRDALPLTTLLDVDPELYMDYQFNRPTVGTDEHGVKRLTWPGATMYGPAGRGRARGIAPEVSEPEESVDSVEPSSRPVKVTAAPSAGVPVSAFTSAQPVAG